MVQVQVDLDKQENKLVNLHKADQDLPSKEAAIKSIIRASKKKVD